MLARYLFDLDCFTDNRPNPLRLKSFSQALLAGLAAACPILAQSPSVAFAQLEAESLNGMQYLHRE